MAVGREGWLRDRLQVRVNTGLIMSGCKGEESATLACARDARIHDLLLLGEDKVQPVKYAAARTASGLLLCRPRQDIIRRVIHIYNGSKCVTRERTLVQGSPLHYTHTVETGVIMQPE